MVGQFIYQTDECTLRIYITYARQCNWDRGVNDFAITAQVQVAVNTFH